MKVNLISYTKPADGFDPATAPRDLLELVAYCARVSNPANQHNNETSEKLVQYLVRNAHWSPLEMASICLEIETTRDIARQFLRHRSFSFQEFSQRYADPTDALSFETRDARFADPNNRQNSIPVDPDHAGQVELNTEFKRRQESHIQSARDLYSWATSYGIAKEQARAVLPEGNTMSKLYVNGTVRSWCHYIEVRSANGTQSEHMEVANACAAAIAQIFPMVNDFVGVDIASKE